MRHAINLPGPRRGGFSDAVKAPGNGSLLFMSGLTSRGPDGEIVGVDDPVAQIQRVVERLGEVVSQAGGTLDHIVQIRVLVRKIEHWSLMEPTFDTCWGEVWPACTLFEVSRLFAEDLLVEVEAIAAIPQEQR